MSTEDLLKILEAHGQQFMQSFDTPTTITGKRKDSSERLIGPSRKKKRMELEEKEEEDNEEEWGGIRHSSVSEGEENTDSASEDGHDVNDGEEDEDDDFTYQTSKPQPDVVVFSETGKSSLIQKASKSGFMSSKVTKLTQEATTSSRKKASSDDEDEELTNVQNDALLHRLVHTKLLSGSLDPELDLTPAKRKKALEGRILEAAGKAKLGKGEAAVRQAERNRAAKNVRDGLNEKQQERRQKELEEAKHLGNYHPTLKALYDVSDSKSQNRKRDRGMKMGVGSFKGGILRLSRNEISAVESRGGGSRGRGGRRRGGKR